MTDTSATARAQRHRRTTTGQSINSADESANPPRTSRSTRSQRSGCARVHVRKSPPRRASWMWRILTDNTAHTHTHNISVYVYGKRQRHSVSVWRGALVDTMTKCTLVNGRVWCHILFGLAPGPHVHQYVVGR